MTHTTRGEQINKFTRMMRAVMHRNCAALEGKSLDDGRAKIA
jgi:hypothetical protein